MKNFVYDVKMLIIGVLLGIIVLLLAADSGREWWYRPYGFSISADAQAIIEREPGRFYIVLPDRRQAYEITYPDEQPRLDMPPDDRLRRERGFP